MTDFCLNQMCGKPLGDFEKKRQSNKSIRYHICILCRRKQSSVGPPLLIRCMSCDNMLERTTDMRVSPSCMKCSKYTMYNGYLVDKKLLRRIKMNDIKVQGDSN